MSFQTEEYGANERVQLMIRENITINDNKVFDMCVA